MIKTYRNRTKSCKLLSLCYSELGDTLTKCVDNGYVILFLQVLDERFRPFVENQWQVHYVVTVKKG